MGAPPWHATIGLGTDGGQLLADGDRFARGIHLLWTLHPDLGFPTAGYDVRRRRHADAEWACLDADVPLRPPPGAATSWSWRSYRLEIDPGAARHDPDSCPPTGALHLPGTQRSLTVESPGGMVAVRVSGVGTPPLLELLAGFGSSRRLVARARATSRAGKTWADSVWAEGISAVRLSGDDLRVCQVCFGEPIDSEGWERLTVQPLLLPVVAAGTANDAEHLHGAEATGTEAYRRLSGTLSPQRRQELADGLAAEPRELLEDLLRRGPGAALPAQASRSASGRTPPRLSMSAAALVALTALDPDVARMLGLSWHDPVDAGRWDYQVVAHHGQVRYPGSSVTFDDLPVGALGSSRLVSDGLTIVGASGLEVVAASGTSGHALALRVPPPLVGTAAGVRFAMPTPSMTLRLDGATVVQFAAWRGARRVGSATSVTGTVTLEDPEGIDTVTWSTGPLDLLEVRRRDGVGLVGDLVAHVWDVSPAAPRAVRGLALTRGNATVEPTRLGVHGTAPAARGVVGLDWEATDPVEDVHRPVRAQVGLLHPDDDGTRRPIVRNAALSTPAFAEPAAHAELGRVANRRGPDLPQRYVERGLGPGSYTWTVRGIDAFGRLGAWSPELAVTVAAGTTPPPPEAVEAAFLDPADPLLSPEHRALVERDGSGLLVSWAWPARRRIAAPGFEPDGEFRVLTRRGDPNLHAGTVLAVSVLGDTSLLDTDLTVAGPASALAGERVRVNGTSFPVVANGTGRRAWLEVAHRVNPTVKPQPGPCTISVSEAGALHVDLTDPRSFDVPVHVEPVGVREQVTATVVAVERGSGTDPVTATVTLDAALPDGAVTATPGRLVAADVAWRVLSQTRGSARLVVQASPQVDGSAAWPSVGQRCTLWAGARYEVWLPGFDARPTASRQVALTLVSVTARDVSAGGLEGPAARAARVEVPHRGAPEAVVVSRPPMHDGDIPADRTAPADWHGRARYLLGFTPALGATGYRVLRVSVAALAEADRAARAAGAPPYQTGPFDDAGDSRAWLTEHHPSIGVTDLTADLSTHPDALSVLAAWREWTAWYYPRRLNRELMALAELECNQAAFCPAHEGTIPGPPFMDSLDGRGLGRYLYRVRPVDASHNVGAWSAAFPVVEVYDVTPPAVPSLVSVSGGEHEVTLRWRANREPDLSGYRIWRARSAAELVDVRRRPVHAVAFPNAPTGTEVWTDAGLAAGVDVAYRIAAVDTTGNVSVPTAVATARPVDTVPPNPTVWRSAEWGRDGRRPAVILAWEVDESGLRCRLERRADIARTWTSLTGWLAAEEPRAHDDAAHAFRHVDATADPGRRWFYRVRVRDASGNLATGMVELFVDAREEAGD